MPPRSITLDEALSKIKEVHKDRFSYLEGFTVANKEKALFLCNWCGNTISVLPGNLMRGQGCKICANNQKKTPSQYSVEVKAVNPLIEVIESYINAHLPIKHKCLDCGNIWKTSPTHILSGVGCPACSTSIKKMLCGTPVRGREDVALKILRLKYPRQTIEPDLSSNLPNFWYRFAGKNTWTRPDFRIGSLYFEVKSLETFGLKNKYYYRTPAFILFRKMKARRRQLYSKGYRFIVIDKGKEVPLPRNWYKMNLAQVKKQIFK